MALAPDGTPTTTGVPPVAEAIAAPRTFREHYTIDANDPFRGRYGSIYSLFATERTPPNSGDQIVTTLVQTELSTPKTIMGLFQDNRDPAGLTMVFHGIHKMPTSLDATTPWDGKTLMLAGDVVNGQISSVEMPSIGFNLANNGNYTVVPASMDLMDEVLAANPNLPLLGPYTWDEGKTTAKARSRYFIWVPPRYVPIVANRRLNPRQLWDQLGSAIKANNEVLECKELMTWMMIALTRAATNASSVLLTTLPTLPSIPDEAYFRRQHEVLTAQLPGLLAPADTTNTAATAQLVAFVGQLVEEQRQSRAEARDRTDEKRTPKTPTAYWGEEAVIYLCNLCDVNSEDELPNVWAAIAAAGKRDRIAIENSILATARSMQLVESAPVVTPEFAKKVTNLQLAGNDVDNFDEGVQPFALLVPNHGLIASYTNKTEIALAQQMINEYDLMTDGSVNTSLADAKSIRTPHTKQRLVKDLSHLRTILEAQHIVLQTILGSTHPVTASFNACLQLYCRRENFFKARLDALGVEHAPSRLLRYVQIRLVNWFRAVRNTGARQTAPDFVSALHSLDNCETQWIPSLPAQYMTPAYHKQAAPTSAPPAAVPLSSGSSTSGNTGVSSLTTPSTFTTKRVTVVNPNKSTLFTALSDSFSRGKINSAIKEHGPPPSITHNGTTMQMCASYHLRGVCWSTCPRAADHVAHSTQDDEALLAWCTKALTQA